MPLGIIPLECTPLLALVCNPNYRRDATYLSVISIIRGLYWWNGGKELLINHPIAERPNGS